MKKRCNYRERQGRSCNNNYNNNVYCTSVIYYCAADSHQNNNKLRQSVDKSSVYNSGERGALYDRPLLPIKIPIVGVVLDGRARKARGGVADGRPRWPWNGFIGLMSPQVPLCPVLRIYARHFGDCHEVGA